MRKIRPNYASVFLLLLVLYGVITTIAIMSSGKALKLRCDVNEDESSMTTISKQNKSTAESVSELVSIADTFIAKLARIMEGSPAGSDYISRSIPEFIDYLKGIVTQMENILEQNGINVLLSQPVINNHNFSYIHNPRETCSTSKITVLIALPSAPANFKKRQEARRGNRAMYVKNSTNTAKMVFFLGRPARDGNGDKIQMKIENEVKTFSDIVQEDFEDVYSNIRLKSVSMLRWVSTYCQNTKYVIRSDDDITVNVSLLVSVLDRTAEKMNNFIIGRQRVNDVPDREPKSKYYLSQSEYPPHTFPPYLLGGVLGYPITSVQRLYEAALRVKPIWLEDIYISALCASKVHVPIVTHPNFTFQHPYS